MSEIRSSVNSPLHVRYATAAPNPQQTLDLFSEQWACRLPGEFGLLKAGGAGAFEDPRMVWAGEAFAQLGRPIEGGAVVELGPLEGAHTWMLSRMGARSVTAVEAHSGAYLKCLLVKELLGMERVNFLYGDAVAYLRETDWVFDVGIASGILYHMANPVELIELLARRCRAIFIWTVHWDPAFSAAHPDQRAGSGACVPAEQAGFKHTLHRHDYGAVGNYGAFWGGPADHGAWMERDEILGALRHFGFTRQLTRDEDNPNGRALWVAAVKD